MVVSCAYLEMQIPINLWNPFDAIDRHTMRWYCSACSYECVTDCFVEFDNTQARLRHLSYAAPVFVDIKREVYQVNNVGN